MNERHVLITTEFRGVFFGKVIDDSDLPNKITLGDCRNCLYWSSDVGGFLGLAEDGPTENCKLGKMVKKSTLWKVTSMTECSPKAVERWKK